MQKFVERAKDKNAGFQLMGFGHRVYKNFDPRAKIIKDAADKVLTKLGINDPLLDIAKALEEAALKDGYFVERKLYPNVDFYSGIIYRAIGFPTNMFTVLFALGRLPGWIAHWKEMNDSATQDRAPAPDLHGRTRARLRRHRPPLVPTRSLARARLFVRRHQRKGFCQGLGGLPVPRLYVVLQTGCDSPTACNRVRVRNGRGLLRVSLEVGPLRRARAWPRPVSFSVGSGWGRRVSASLEILGGAGDQRGPSSPDE